MKNYLITGATSSLGTVLARKIIQDYGTEAKLCLLSRSHSADLAKLEAPNVKYVSGIDLITLERDGKTVHEIKDFFKSSFSIVHTAGDFWLHLPFLKVKTEQAIQMMNSQYATFYNVLQCFIPYLVEQGGGRILTFSCNATDHCFPNMLPFTAAKAAVDATVKCIAHEHSKDGIVINSLALSSLQTEKNKKATPYGDFENYLNLERLSNVILDTLNQRETLMNGSIIRCFRYSDSYYHQGYFERIKQDE